MSRTWIFALAGVALVAAALVWFLRDEKRTPPEPVSAPLLTARPPAEPAPAAAAPIERAKEAACTPLPDGGLSCGACRDNADCPEASTCVVNRQSGRTECLHRSCEKNEDCKAGALCRVVGRTSSDAPLRACVMPGDRPAGAACDQNNGGDPAVSCGPKLVCVGGGCAPACVPPEVDDDPVCPGQHACVQTEAGPGCVPNCKIDGCSGGKTCSFLSVENPISLCTFPDGPNCLGSKGGCPTNTDCVAETNPRSERTTFRCYPRCGADQNCPDGSVCVPGSLKNVPVPAHLHSGQRVPVWTGRALHEGRGSDRRLVLLGDVRSRSHDSRYVTEAGLMATALMFGLCVASTSAPSR